MTYTEIFNCKRCKLGKRIEYPEQEKEYLGYGRYATRHYRKGRVVNLGFGRTGELRIYPQGDELCAKCGKPMEHKRLESYVNEGVPCDARCTGARGHTCECSCGGAHHGQDWC